MIRKENAGEGNEVNVLSSLSSVLNAVHKAVNPENTDKDICRVFSEQLAAQGFFNIILKYTRRDIEEKKGKKEKEKKKKKKKKRKESAKSITISHVGIPPQTAKTVEALTHISCEGNNVSLKALPFEKLESEGAVFIDFGEVIFDLLGISVPPPSSEYTPPHQGMIVSADDTVLVTALPYGVHDKPFLSVIRNLLEAALSVCQHVKQLKEQKDFLEEIVERVQDGILLEDPEGKIIFANPKLLDMLGYTEEELLGSHYSRIAHPDSVSIARKETRKRAQGIQNQYEACLQCKDETSIPVIVSATPLFENGVHTGNLTVFTDRSAQKEAEDRIRNLKEFSENVIQSLHEAIMIEDAKGFITFVNPKLEELLEVKREKILGNHWREFIAPAYLEKVEKESTKRKHNISGQYEAALHTDSGKTVPVMVGATPLFEDDTFTGVISVCVDLSMVKEKEKEIKQKNEDLRLLSKINHALNTGEHLDTILNMVRQELELIFDSEALAILFFGEDQQSIRLQNLVISPLVRRILDKDPETSLCFSIEKESILKRVIDEKACYLFEGKDLQNLTREVLPPKAVSNLRQETQVRSAVVVPLVVEEEVAGTIIIGSKRVLDQDDLSRAKSLCRHLTLAINHARLDETLKKTSDELQTHLAEQTSLREMVERLFAAGNQKEVVDIVGEGLRGLRYEYSGMALKEPGRKFVRLLHVHPSDILKKVSQAAEDTSGEEFHLKGISLPKNQFLQQDEMKRIALVTNNIVLHREKHVIHLPLQDFVSVWVGSEAEERVIETLGLESLICIPFHVRNKFGGALIVASKGTLMHHDFVILETLGQIISEALERLQYSETLHKKSQDLEFSNRQLSLLQELTNALNSTMDLEEILKVLVKGISSVFEYIAPSVYLLSEDKDYLVVKEFDISSRLLDGITRLVGFNLEQYKIPLFEDSLLKKVLDEGKPLITNDIPFFLRNYTEKESLRRLAGALYKMGKVSWVCALPLMEGNEPVGMLVFGSKTKVEQEDIDALNKFLDQAVLAVYRARLYEQLKEANQMKSEFIDIASHELRTPLTSMKLYLEMIQMGRYGDLTPELREKIKLLQASAEKLQEIIDKTLVSGRIRKKKLELRKEEISLVELIHDVKTQLRPLWEQKKQNIEIRAPYKLSSVEVDSDALWKVVTALMDNAVKYSPRDSRITVKLYDHEDVVEVAIMDEGVGIKQEHQNKIFDPFFIIPSEAELSRMDGRTGLGLFIAKGIIEEHNGRIWVESVYGLGSTFHFTIPK